jgi:hypothetical protein
LIRRDYGKTVTGMSQRLSYQFCQIFLVYNNRISEVPMDSHMLIFFQIRELPRGLAS